MLETDTVQADYFVSSIFLIFHVTYSNTCEFLKQYCIWAAEWNDSTYMPSVEVFIQNLLAFRLDFNTCTSYYMFLLSLIKLQIYTELKGILNMSLGVHHDN